jgi:hypothetical protein
MTGFSYRKCLLPNQPTHCSSWKNNRLGLGVDGRLFNLPRA